MITPDSISVLRQQIALIRSVLDLSDKTLDEHSRLSLYQGVILMASKTLVIQAQQVGNVVPEISDLTSLFEDANAVSDSFSHSLNYRNGNAPIWLVKFIDYYRSIEFTKREWEEQNQVLDRASQSNLIASTEAYSPEHWSLVSREFLSQVVDEVETLLERHIENDLEY